MKTFISTLAITLAIMSMATPADAGLTNIQQCDVFRAKTEMKFSKCMKIANLLEAKGKTADRAKCVTKYDGGITEAKTKFVNEKLNVTEAECGLEQASTDAVKALDIVSAGQELATFGLEHSDLEIGADIQSLIDDAVAAVDITLDNQTVCEAAGGTWENDACTERYNCAIGAICSYWAATFPDDTILMLHNKYIGHTRSTGGCLVGVWDTLYSYQIRMKNLYPSDTRALFDPGSIQFGVLGMCE
jgi:hypothetical protein